MRNLYQLLKQRGNPLPQYSTSLMLNESQVAKGESTDQRFWFKVSLLDPRRGKQWTSNSTPLHSIPFPNVSDNPGLSSKIKDCRYLLHLRLAPLKT